jgi:hypothetical protein
MDCRTCVTTGVGLTPRRPRLEAARDGIMSARNRIQAGVWLKAVLIGIVALIFVLEAAHNRSRHTGLFVAHGSIAETLQDASSP